MRFCNKPAKVGHLVKTERLAYELLGKLMT